MTGRAKSQRGPAKASSLSAEDRAFLDFVARLAVDEALREAKAAREADTCGGDSAEEKSGNDGNA